MAARKHTMSLQVVLPGRIQNFQSADIPSGLKPHSLVHPRSHERICAIFAFWNTRLARTETVYGATKPKSKPNSKYGNQRPI